MKKLYVGNLPYSATEGDLETFFTGRGVKLDSVALIRDRDTGNPRGFAFVEIEDDGQADQAVETCNGQDLSGRPLVVNEARPRVPSFGGGGGGGGGDYGGGGGGGDRPRGKGKKGKGSRRGKPRRGTDNWG